MPMKHLFYDLYGKFTVIADNCLPIVVVHFTTEDLGAFQIGLTMDLRSIFFRTTDEPLLISQLKKELWSYFQKIMGNTLVSQGQ